MSNETLLEGAQRLADAWFNRQTIDFLPELLPKDRQEAYAVQDKMAELIGDEVLGWKVGATSPGVQKAEGYDGPIPGRIFASTLVYNRAVIPIEACPHAKIEAEIAFRFTTDLEPNAAPFTAESLTERAIMYPAFDITSTRYNPATRATWDKTQNMLAGIADNGNGGAVLVGPAIHDWQKHDLMALAVELSINRGELVPNLFGDFRGDPIDGLAWTVNSVIERGFGFQEGDFVLTGSLTEPQEVQAGDIVTAYFPYIAEISTDIVSKVR